MSSIIQRGKNSWRIKFDIEAGPDGKRQTRFVTFRGTSKEAKIEAAKITSAMSRGEYVEGSKETVAQFVERWLRDWAKGNTSNKTYSRYEEILRLHVTPHVGTMRIQRLRAADLQAMYATLQRETGLAARTVLHVHRVTHRMLRHAAQWGVVHQNAAALVDAPKVKSTQIDILTPAQVQAVLRTLKGQPIYAIATVALGTGMRRGEMLALRWQDVDLDAAVLRVERSLEQTKAAGLVFKEPKTKHGRRTITLPASTVAELRAHRAAQNERRLGLGLGKAPDDALVFPHQTIRRVSSGSQPAEGAPRSPNALTKEWEKAVAKAEIGATLHSLRHTHASTLIASGLDVLTISRRLGHGSPAITLTVYGHLFKTDDRAAQIMEASFAGLD